jgi:hypothetical protein
VLRSLAVSWGRTSVRHGLWQKPLRKPNYLRAVSDGWQFNKPALPASAEPARRCTRIRERTNTGNAPIFAIVRDVRNIRRFSRKARVGVAAAPARGEIASGCRVVLQTANPAHTASKPHGYSGINARSCRQNPEIPNTNRPLQRQQKGRDEGRCARLGPPPACGALEDGQPVPMVVVGLIGFASMVAFA